LLVTHERVDAARLSSRTIVLEAGRVVQASADVSTRAPDAGPID
jgi:ABC-type sulfate/molybdate transport systems ATPase subunit